MRYFTIPPTKRLAPYVRYFWVLEGEATSSVPYVHRSMADGCSELLFHYQGVFRELVADNKTETSFRSGLAGQSQIIRRFTIQQNFGIFGAYLYPFTASHLFSVCASTLKNQMIDLNDLIGEESGELEERMMLAYDNRERFEILSGFLERKIPVTASQSPGVFETIQYIIDTKGITNVDELARRSFLSTRQFERQFLNFTGFNPKLFSRITRFKSAVEQYGNDAMSLTALAHETGYYDQSHFIQEFREFSGHNPKEYFSGKTETTVWKD